MDQIDFMRSWLRVKSISDVSEMSDLEVIKSYILLSPPKVMYGEWVQTLSELLGGEQKEAQEQPEPRMDPFERLKIEGQHLFKEGIVQFGPPEEAKDESNGDESVDQAT